MHVPPALAARGLSTIIWGPKTRLASSRTRYSCFHKTITNRTMQVIQRKISEHSLWRVALPMCKASWPSFLRLWFSQRHKPVRGATVSVAAPKNSEVNGAFHTTRRTQVKSVSSSYGFAIDFGVTRFLDWSQL